MTVDEIMKLVSAYEETCLECIDMNHKHLNCVRRSERRTALESVIEVLAKERDELKAAISGIAIVKDRDYSDRNYFYCSFCSAQIYVSVKSEDFPHGSNCIVKKYEVKG